MGMISDQAFVLHKRPFKDNSELLKVLTKNNGIIDLVGKGSRNPKSKFKGQLQPFIETEISYAGKSDLKTLVQSEQVGLIHDCAYINHVSMLYCNELLLLLKLNDEHQADLYQDYARTIEALKVAKSVSYILRQFEWRLCCSQGYELSLPETIKATDYVSFCPVNGLVLSQHNKNCTAESFVRFINGEAMDASRLKAVNHLMRDVINHMVHGKVIQSRALLINPTSSK